MYYRVQYSEGYGDCGHHHRTPEAAAKCMARETGQSFGQHVVSAKGFHAHIQLVTQSGIYEIQEMSDGFYCDDGDLPPSVKERLEVDGVELAEQFSQRGRYDDCGRPSPGPSPVPVHPWIR